MHFMKWITVLLMTAIFMTNVSSKKHVKKKKEWKESTCGCGTPSSILNLQTNILTSEKYPWVVNLMDKKNNMTTFCVGAIISMSLVLTSASCLTKTQRNTEENGCAPYKKPDLSCFKSHSDIGIGFPIVTETSSIFSRAGASVKKIIPYSHLRDYNLETDLVLLRISPTFDCEDVPRVCLTHHKLVKTWTTGIIVGWKTNYVKSESLNMEESEIPITAVYSRNCTKIQGHHASKQAILCPLKNESASYCKGYAGAPIVVRVKHRFHLIGVMSKTIIDDECEKHDIYPLTCIQKYLPWIHKQMKKEENLYVDKRFSNRSY